MREILFRGRNENSTWIYGSLLVDKDTFDKNAFIYYICDIDGYSMEIVNTKTIGQFTGLTDKNGTKIFEGDIVHWKKVPYFVRWDSKKAEFVFANDMEADYFVVGFNEHTTMKFCKVIGNIHDNPELLNK